MLIVFYLLFNPSPPPPPSLCPASVSEYIFIFVLYKLKVSSPGRIGMQPRMVHAHNRFLNNRGQLSWLFSSPLIWRKNSKKKKNFIDCEIYSCKQIYLRIRTEGSVAVGNTSFASLVQALGSLRLCTPPKKLRKYRSSELATKTCRWRFNFLKQNTRKN